MPPRQPFAPPACLPTTNSYTLSSPAGGRPSEMKRVVVTCHLMEADFPGSYDIVFVERDGPAFHHYGYIVPDIQSLLRACDTMGDLHPGLPGFLHPDRAWAPASPDRPLHDARQ
jgi:hypothetical protein